MKSKELKELETKDLAEKLETEVAKYNQMKLNHAITPMAYEDRTPSERT